MQGIVIKYLSRLSYNSYIKEFEEAYFSHPNFPSLLAITDSLSNNTIENIAANVPFKHIDELPNLFLTELTMK